MSGSVHLQISDLAPGPLRGLNNLPGGHQLCLQLRPRLTPGLSRLLVLPMRTHISGGKKGQEGCFRPVSNQGPFSCEATVITTTLRKRDNFYCKTVSMKSRGPAIGRHTTAS